MDYSILDDYVIRRYKPKGQYPILIRLLEPYYQDIGIPYNILYESHYVAILEVYADDIREWSPKANQFFTLFNEDMKQQILSFIAQHPFDELVVHCNKGCSRSPAVMLGIADFLEQGDWIKAIRQNPNFLPNELILSVFNLSSKKITPI